MLRLDSRVLLLHASSTETPMMGRSSGKMVLRFWGVGLAVESAGEKSQNVQSAP